MKRSMMFFAALTAFAVVGCAQLQGVVGGGLPQTPEAQIAAGANALTAATTLATVALKNDKVTVTQAKSYRTVLGAASSALDDANGALVKCRGATGSTAATSPDPCKAGVVAIVTVALESIASVKKTLDAVSP